jgi:hypothetical protein
MQMLMDMDKSLQELFGDLETSNMDGRHRTRRGTGHGQEKWDEEEENKDARRMRRKSPESVKKGRWGGGGRKSVGTAAHLMAEFRR